MAVFKAGKRDRQPTHPGAIIRGALEALDVSARQAALAIGVTPAGLGRVVMEKGPVTIDMALLISAYLGTGKTGPEHLLNMQMDHDLWRARQEMKARLAKVKPAGKR